MQQKKYLIYLHRNKINGRCYVGQTGTTIQKRWGVNGIAYKKQEYFYSDIEKFGWDNFDHIILEQNLSKDEVNDREKYWIKYYHALAPQGYCLTSGGSDHFSFSQESLKKRSNESKKNWQNEDYRKKISQQRKKTWQNPIYRENALKKLNDPKRPAFGSQKVLCVETGQIFSSFREAERNKHISRDNISKTCKGQRETAGGYHWKIQK